MLRGRRVAFTAVNAPTAVTTAHEVTCTNCGGTDWASLVIALVALAVAVASLAVALKALRIQSREHAAFLARPDIEFEPETLPAADEFGVVHVGSHSAVVRVNLGFRNVGGRAGENFAVNILLPRAVSFFVSDSRGRRLSHGEPDETAELLPDAAGSHVAAHWAGRDIGHVGVGNYTPVWITVSVEIPPEDDSITIPIRLRVLGDMAGGENGRKDFDYPVRVAS